jgi:FkbM family methyltransferase
MRAPAGWQRPRGVTLPVITAARSVARFVWSHPANEGKRGRAMLRAVGFQARGRLMRRRTLARLGDRSCIWADLHRTGAAKVVYANPPDHSEMMMWRDYLRPGDLFVDVGANVGSYAVWAAELGAEVIALEPASDTFALLAENVALNGYPIKPVQAAAGASCGTARITNGQDTANRLDPVAGAETAMVTVDSVVGSRVVAGMKVDVEGFELDVLRGCERALSQQRIRLIQLEWNAASLSALGTDRVPVAALLARHGYRLYRPGNDGTLTALTDLGFGADVFACPGTQGGLPGRQVVDYY